MYSEDYRNIMINEIQDVIDEINDIYNKELKKDFEELRLHWKDASTNILLNKLLRVELGIKSLTIELEDLKYMWMDYDSGK